MRNDLSKVQYFEGIEPILSPKQERRSLLSAFVFILPPWTLDKYTYMYEVPIFRGSWGFLSGRPRLAVGLV